MVHCKSLARDEFETLLKEASSIVNNTPLWDASDDPNDPKPLTPQMLLTLKNTSESCSNFSSDDLQEYGIKRWKRVQYLADEFWKLWRKSYLQDLQVRQKWTTKRPCLQEGDVVLLKQTSKRNTWPLGLIETANVSDDGLVRSVKVKTARVFGGKIKTYFYDRPISEVVLLHRPTLKN